MKVVLAVAGVLLLTTTVAVAQQGKTAKEKAPAGCVACEALCDWCMSLGLQAKSGADKCHSGCRSWGAMVGLKTVYVHKNRSLCGASTYAPRCN